MKKTHFNKELVMAKKDNEDFENSTKCWICDKAIFSGGYKLKDHCHINGKYRGFAQKFCRISLPKKL